MTSEPERLVEGAADELPEPEAARTVVGPGTWPGDGARRIMTAVRGTGFMILCGAVGPLLCDCHRTSLPMGGEILTPRATAVAAIATPAAPRGGSGAPAPKATSPSLTVKSCATSPARGGVGSAALGAYRAGAAPWPAWDVEVSGRYAFVAGYDESLRIVDLADATRPREVAAWPAGSGPGYPGGDVALDGDRAYIARHGQVDAVDVSDPARLAYPSAPRPDAVYSGNGYDSTFRIVAAAGRLYTYDRFGNVGVAGDGMLEPPAFEVLLESEILDLAAGDGLLVASLGPAGIQILDLSDPDRPRAAGKLGAGWPAARARIADGVAYVSEGYGFDEARSDGGLRLVDVSDVDAPRELGHWTPATQSELARATVVDADAAGGRAVALIDEDGQGFRLVRLDVSEPTQPRATGWQADSGWERLEDEPEVRLTGDLAVIAGGMAGLRVVDVSRSEVREVGAIDPPDGALDVAVDGNLACVPAWSDGLRVMDVSDPTAAREVGLFDTPGYVVDVALADGLAFVAASEDGLRVLDLRNPSEPREVGRFDVPGRGSEEGLAPSSVTGVDVVDGYAYVTSSDGQLTVLDVIDPAHPRPVGRWEGESPSMEGVLVAGGVAYLAGWTQLDLVDVRDPMAPRGLGAIAVPFDPDRPWWGGVQDLAVVGSTVYVAAGANGVLVVDVSDPTAPVLRQTLAAPVCSNRSGGDVTGIEASGDSLWLADGWACLVELRLQRAADASPWDGDWCANEVYHLPGTSRRVKAVGDRVYVAASNGGLWVLSP